jgi:hypothetical protein
MAEQLAVHAYHVLKWRPLRGVLKYATQSTGEKPCQNLGRLLCPQQGCVVPHLGDL